MKTILELQNTRVYLILLLLQNISVPDFIKENHTRITKKKKNGGIQEFLC